MKGVLTQFPSVQSHNGLMMCLSTLCVVVTLNNEFQIRFKDFKPAKFTVSFITNLSENSMNGSGNDKFIYLFIYLFLCSRKICVD
jgi:hypothetical protein